MSGRAAPTSRLAAYVPAVGWLGDYQRPWLRGDLAAGVTTAAVVIPQAMAYATIAGLPVQAGLYVATVPMLVYALLGTSRPLSVSTTSTLSALTAAAVAVAAAGDPARVAVAASTLAALAGGLLFLTPQFENLPEATLGAVVIVAVAGLVDLEALRRIREIRVRDFGLALVALAGVLVLGVLQGVLLAVVVSMLTLVYGANHPPIEVLGRKPGTSFWRDRGRHPDDETVPGLMVIRPVAGIYFANAPRLRRRLLDLVDAAAPQPDVLLVDFGAVPDVDISALDLLPTVDAELRGRGITLWLANINTRPLEMLRRLPDVAEWEQRMFREVDDAVTAFAAR
jgi:MFS superfamily sulfate permease-like transporter